MAPIVQTENHKLENVFKLSRECTTCVQAETLIMGFSLKVG